jgi:hypothetical protein
MANKVSSNGDDSIGSAYSGNQGRGQMGYGADDAGGVHKRNDGFGMGRVYKRGQDGAYGYARGATRFAEGAEGRLGFGSSKGRADC